MNRILLGLFICLLAGCDAGSDEGPAQDAGVVFDSQVEPDADEVGSEDGGATEPLSPFGRLQADVLIPYCANGGCHGGTPSMGNGMLVLDGEESHGQLVGVEPFNASARESGMLLVDPGDLENSFLWEKMILEASDPLLGNPMPPFAFEPLTEQALEQVKEWIEAGAVP